MANDTVIRTAEKRAPELKPNDGPWFVSNGCTKSGLAIIERGTHEDNWIAECEFQNAPVISAAMDLLAAAELAVDWLVSTGADGSPLPTLQAAIKKARTNV